MSWLGGSISSLTGQLTNLTKDILTEGTEEVSDHATELRIAQEKINECQTTITTLNSENERLKRLNHELEEKAEASELQINSISREYRTLLEEKEKEINNLKQLQHEAAQHHLKSSTYDNTENVEALSQAYHRLDTSNAGYNGSQFSGDHLDFSDNISMQHEINRLTQEIKKLRAECKHWKTVATDRSDRETTERKPDSSSEVVDLQNRIKELNEQRNNDKEQHQHEIASLQDVHSQKLAALRKKLKSDTAEFKQRIAELENQQGNTDHSKGDSEESHTIIQLQSQLQSMEEVKIQIENDNKNLTESLNTMKEEIDKLKEERSENLSKIDDLTQQVQLYKTDLQKKEEEMCVLKKDYDQVCSGLDTTKFQLLDQLDANHAQSLELLGDIQEVRRQMGAEVINRRDKLLKEKQDLIIQIYQSGQKQQSLRSSLTELEKDYERTSLETDQIVKDLGDSEHQKLTGDIMDSFEKENLMLKKKNVELQEQVVLLERAVHSITEERQTCERKITDMQQQIKSLQSKDKPVQQTKSDEETNVDNQSDVQTVTSDLSELSRQNEGLDRQVSVLKEQISKYEQEIDQFEVIKSDWQNEKEALEDVLMQLREQLREREMSLNVIEAQKGLMEVERQGKKSKSKTKDQIKHENNKEKGLLELERHEYERSDCSSDSDDTIDSTNGDIGADIEKLDHKVELLTQANAQLENERDLLLNQKASMEEELLSLQDTVKPDAEDTLQLKQQIKEKDECIATLALEKENLEKNIREMNTVQHQLDLKDRIIAEITQEKNEIEESLEELDNQHQEAMAQLIKMRDDLSKKLENISHELDEKEDQIKALLSENEKLKENVSGDTDLVPKHSETYDQELSSLRDKIDEFESKTKTLEKMVSDLGEDVKKKDREILDLQDKLHKGAVVVNDLHMDKQELEYELNKCKDQISEKVQKLKEIREKNSDFETTIVELNKRIESLERMNESLEHQINSVGTDGRVEIEQLQKQLDEKMTVSERAGEKLTELEEKLNNSDVKYREAVKKINDFESQVSSLQQQLVNVKELQEKQYIESCQEFESRISSLQSEKNSLEKDVNQLEQTLQSKVKHYENYIQDLQKSKEIDSNSIQQEHQQLMQVSHEKDLKITQLEGEISTLQSYLEETEENLQASINKQKDMRSNIIEKDEEIHKLNNRIIVLSEEINGHLSKITEQESLLESMQDIQNNLSEIQEENQSLKSEIEDLNRSLQDSSDREEMKTRSLEVLPDLESELKRSNNKIDELSCELKKCEKIIKDHEAGINELNQRRVEQNKKLSENAEKLESQDDLIAVLQQSTKEKDQEVIFLKNKLRRATSLIEVNKQQLLDDAEEIHPNFNLQAIEYPEKGALELKEVEIEGIKRIEANRLGSESKKIVERNEELEREFSIEKDENVIQEMEQLQKLLQEKDSVINELQNNNKSLLKMLESKSKSLLGDKSLVDFHQLENEVSSLKLEREQIMAVMNEKSRECSNLKSEVHRLMNVISAEKVALEKLQKDNHELTQRKENSMDDMQKEALQNLSRLVRDKDLEIDALTQKNQTLLLMLQDTSTSGTEVTGLMQDKDNLSKQLTALQNEREQLISCVNQKHQESVSYHGEIQRLTAFMNTEKEKFEETHRNYENLVKQFEDKKQTLLKTQNELINYKQKFTELEIKYGELLQQSNASETIDMTSYNVKLEEIKRLQEKQKEYLDSSKEKEMKIQSLHQQNIEYEEILANRDLELSNQKKQIDNLTFQLQGVQTELTDIKNERLLIDQQMSEKISQINMMKEANDRLTLTLQEREFELKSFKEKVETLTAVVQDRKGEKGSVDKLMKENETVMLQAKHLQQERDQAMMAVKQRLVENEDLSREIQKLKEKENKSSRELDRLRNHLLQMEESYTREALDAEEREKELRNRLVIAEEKILSSSTRAESANQHASEQVENLQQQLYAVAGQRDQAYLQYSTLQDQCQQYASSLANLQMVLEQFQQEKECQVATEVEHFQKEAYTLEQEVTKLREELEETKTKLEEAEDGLEAAHRLSEQLDKREEAILALKEEVQLREKALKEAEDKLKALITSQDNKVDKLVIKNLFMGYFTTPKGQKHQVLLAIGGVLDFNQEDFNKIEGTGSGWVPGFLRFGSKPSTPSTPSTPYFTPPHTPTLTAKATPHSVNKSFSELFVKFLENESTPPPPAMRLPAEEMAQDVHRQRETSKPAYNPFTAPRHVAMPIKIGEQQTSQGSAILMSTAPLSPTLPLFTPLSANDSSHSPSSSGRSTPNTSSAILKDVLGAR